MCILKVTYSTEPTSIPISSPSQERTPVEVIVPRQPEPTSVEIRVPPSQERTPVEVIVPRPPEPTSVEIRVPPSPERTPVEVVVPRPPEPTSVEIRVPPVEVIVPLTTVETRVPPKEPFISTKTRVPPVYSNEIGSLSGPGFYPRVYGLHTETDYEYFTDYAHSNGIGRLPDSVYFHAYDP
jgi:hypothetical protein